MFENTITPREFQVLDLIAEGLIDRQIARRLGISHRTVESHCQSLYRKLNTRNRTEAAFLYSSFKRSICVRNLNYKNPHWLNRQQMWQGCDRTEFIEPIK